MACRISTSQKMEVKRWTCLVAAIWLQSVNGTNFDFSDYSAQLKTIMELNQLKLNSLAVASDLGKSMGWISGIACLYLPTWAVLLIASSLGILGYGMQWLVLSQIINPLSYWKVYIACFMAGNSICWFNTVSFKAAIENFPSRRGMAAGLVTSYVGLSTVMYTCLLSLISPSNIPFYLLLNSIVPAIISLLTAPIFTVSSSATNKAVVEDKSDKTHMVQLTIIAVITAMYSISHGFLPTDKRGLQGAYLALMIVLLAAVPLCIPIKVALTSRTNKIMNANTNGPTPLGSPYLPQHQHQEQQQQRKSFDVELDQRPARSSSQETGDSFVSSKEHETGSKKVMLGQEHGFTQLLLSLDFWLYYVVYLGGGTIGIVFMNNLGQIVESMGYSKTPILVSLISSCGFFGRIAAGFPDYVEGWKRFPRPAWMGIWMVPMAVAFFTLAGISQMSVAVVWVSTAIVGASSGAISTLAISISSELFGVKRFGVNHNILVTNIALGSLVFGEFAAMIYDRGSKGKQGDVCMGRQCYHTSFVAWGGMCALGICLCLVLSMRTRTLYQSLYKQCPYPQ